jgi:hypothetical protein
MIMDEIREVVLEINFLPLLLQIASIMFKISVHDKTAEGFFFCPVFS